MSIYVKQAGTWYEIPSGGGGLSGLGGWADISDTPTSTYTDANGVKWNVWTFNADATLNVAKGGLLDVFLIGCGGPAAAGVSGGGGGVVDGTRHLPAGALPVHVGKTKITAVGWNGGAMGDRSSIGTLATAFSFVEQGSGSLGLDTPANREKGVTSDISGTATEYGIGFAVTPRPGHGDGGRAGDGSDGIVIVRRPA